MWKHAGWTNQFCRTCVNPQAVDPANPLAGWPDQVFVNGTPLTQVDSPAKVTPGTFNIDYPTQTITVGSDPTGQTVESSNRWNAMTVNSAAAGLTLRGIGIAQYAPNWNENQLGALVVAANNVTLENSAVVWNTGRGAQFNSPGGHIVGSRLNNNGYSGLGTNRAHGLVVSRNQIDGNNWRHFAVSGCGMYCTVAGYKAAHTANSTVSDNTVRNNVGTGYWCDLGCNGTTIVRNFVEGNTNKGIFYEVSTTGVIASNVLRRNTVGLELAGTDRTAIYNNTFDRNGTHLELYDDTRLSSSDAYSGGLGLTWDTTGNTLRNNVFAATTGGVAIDTNATSQVNAQQMLAGMDHNAYYRTSATAPLVHWCPTYGAGCPTYTSIAAFAAAADLGPGERRHRRRHEPVLPEPRRRPLRAGAEQLDEHRRRGAARHHRHRDRCLGQPGRSRCPQLGCRAGAGVRPRRPLPLRCWSSTPWPLRSPATSPPAGP